nr:hypothetical protein [Bacteroidaceae bacterium]
FFANHSGIIGEEDCESIYFYSAEFTQSFRDSLEIYKFYYHNYGHDNPRLISRIIRKTLDNEFQTALSFLVEVDGRMKKVGEGLSIICFNNLIKRAPNIGEALGVIPYLSHIQEYTLACMLQVLKRRRIKDERSKTGWVSDPKIFYYAYSVVMRDEFFELRTSPYIIGLLFDLAITPKHEQFIRNIFISQALSSEVREDVRELRKSELIDYSTAIASMRIRKNYRNVKDIWQVFSTCRDYYAQKKMYITSELYSGMMKKIHYLCQHDSAELNQNLEHLQRIINEDWSRIVRDEYFLSTLYRFMPDKHILDDEGHICEDFKKDMQSSNIQQVKVLNCIMYDLRNHGFDTLWQFYEYIVSYYETHAKLRGLMPDYRTITYLLENVQTEEQFLKTDDAAKRWLGSRVFSNNIMYGQAYYHAQKAIGRNVPKMEKDTVATAPERAQSGRTVRTGRRDYRGETDDVINLALMDIYLYGSLTSTLFNQYLKEIIEIVKDIRKDTNMRSEVVKTCIQGTYWNLSKNLLEKHRDDLMFDVDSYVSLIKLSPDSNVAREWVKELARHREAYRFNVVACREIATSVEVSQCDIDLSLDCFEYWERIMNDIGYDPEDPTSASEPTEAKFLPSPMKDYDGYWATRYYHTLREMSHYCYTKARWGGNKDSLTFIKKQMEVFDQYGIPFPVFQSKGRYEAVDFREEVKLLSDEHLNP